MPVKNPLGFNNNWAIQIGQTGEETAEIQLMVSAAGTTMTIGTSSANAGTVLYGHNGDTPIYQLHYDQIVWLRSTSGSTGTPTPIGTTDIDPSSQVSEFNDSSGASTYAYQVQYYNSLNGDLSGTSSWFVPGGPSFYSLQFLRQRVQEKLYSAGYINNAGSTITNWINEWYELMTNAAIKVNQGYMLGTVAIDNIGTNGLGTVVNDDFKNAVKLEVCYDTSNDYLTSKEVPVWSYSQNDFFAAYTPQHAWVGENVFELLPHPTSANQVLVTLTYSQRFSPLVNDSDELTQTLKAYTTCCVEYCLAVAYGLDQKDSQYQLHNQNYLQYKADFIAEVTPRDFTGPQIIDLVESLAGMQESNTLDSEWVL